jgi:hypothetical protein
MVRRITQTLGENFEWIERMERECPDAKVVLLDKVNLIRVVAPGHPDDGLEIEVAWPDEFAQYVLDHPQYFRAAPFPRLRALVNESQK